MDWLYRLLYIVLALDLVMISLLPVVVILRILMRNKEKKFMVWEWRLVFLRSICPVAVTSSICLFPSWNQRFQTIMDSFGLTIINSKGTMQNLSTIFFSKIKVTSSFRSCTYIWIFGMLAVLFAALFMQGILKKRLSAAKILGENIMESPMLEIPVCIGVFHKKIYVPKGFEARETSWLLRHMEADSHAQMVRFVVLIILSIHWLNPVMWLYYYWWSMDKQMAADDKVIQKKSREVQKEYAQGILNFEKKEGIKNQLSLITVGERFVEKRACRMMYQKKDTFQDKLIRVLLWSISILIFFLMLPIQTAWSGGTWGNNLNEKKTEALFQKQTNKVIAETNTVSPNGLERRIRLVMLKGKESETGYDGQFELQMYDSVQNKMATYKIRELFAKLDQNTYHFSKDFIMYAGDYNEDNTQEIVLGQKMALTQKEFERSIPATTAALKVSDYQAYTYGIINVKDKGLEKVCDNIDVITADKEQKESMVFETIDGIKNIFAVPVLDKKIYYEWNEDKSTYEKKELSENEIQKMQKSNSDNKQTGDINEHNLDNDNGKTCVLVGTKVDQTGSEEITSITLNPRNNEKKINNVHGYYCDLSWITSDEKKQYAVLLYNGTKSQTFIIYDVQNNIEYYKQEDGVKNLQKLFEKFGESDITFKKNKAVIYSLSQKNGDVLTIKFAADADNGMTVKGSYDYDVSKARGENLEYTRTVNATPAPTSGKSN